MSSHIFIQWLLQVRQQEFILAKAIEESCKHIITTGFIVSNHCRATSVACVQLGLQPHIFLRTDAKVSVYSTYKNCDIVLNFVLIIVKPKPHWHDFCEDKGIFKNCEFVLAYFSKFSRGRPA